MRYRWMKASYLFAIGLATLGWLWLIVTVAIYLL